METKQPDHDSIPIAAIDTLQETETRLSVDELPEEKPVPPASALTITIQSWATPIVGLLMLIIGLIGGYYARPLVDAPSLIAPATTGEESPPTSQQSAAGDTSEAAAPEQATRQQALMDTLISQVRHFKGNPNAPVTIIEFSDFQ